ncbi:MAG: hypothetical protein HRT89_22180 [Lentisphaeria bacterium]|nr:hypothetical protein [Lentisphaeria bacterium]NQZ70767.1 hypothetical protein [Lentisphaeria bacterium]
MTDTEDYPLKRELLLCLIPFFAWSLLLYVFLSGSTGLVGTDDYFHITVSEKLSSNGLFMKSFPWTTTSLWTDHYFDKEWLFHVLMVPLLSLGKLTAAKFAVYLFNICCLSAAIYFLCSRKVRCIWLWVLFIPLVSHGFFFYRMLMCRPHVFSLAILILCLAFIIQRKHIALGIAAMIYALSYTGHWQLPAICFLFDMFYFFLDEDGKRREKYPRFLPLTVIAIAGIAVGELIHPNFPDNVRGFWIQNVMVLKSYWNNQHPLATMRPVELNPISLSKFVFTFATLLVVSLSAGIYAWQKKLRLNRADLFMMACSATYLVLCCRSFRFIEYATPVYVLTLAMIVCKADIMDLLSRKRLIVIAAIAVFIIMESPGLLVTYSRIASNDAKLKNLSYAADAGDYISKNLEPGDVVFTRKWSTGPYVFFQAPDQYYLNFLDPYFMYVYDPEKLKLWQEIKGGTHPDPATAAQEQFSAKAIFISNESIDYGRDVGMSVLESNLRKTIGAPYISKQGHKVWLLNKVRTKTGTDTGN